MPGTLTVTHTLFCLKNTLLEQPHQWSASTKNCGGRGGGGLPLTQRRLKGHGARQERKGALSRITGRFHFLPPPPPVVWADSLSVASASSRNPPGSTTTHAKQLTSTSFSTSLRQHRDRARPLQQPSVVHQCPLPDCVCNFNDSDQCPRLCL